MNVGVATLPNSATSRETVRNLSNDALIIELINSLNHLSRWLTPIHDRTVLAWSPRRSDPSVKEVLIAMRDAEARAYAFMNAIASHTNPDLDAVPRVEATATQSAADKAADALVVMAEFRRVRESSTSLLRALPDTAWQRGGYSRTERDWTIRELAEFLAVNDTGMLSEVDRALAASGARLNIAEVSQVRFDQIDEPFLPSQVRS